MNRPIKFRVWDKITNQYLQELGIYYWHIPYSLDGEEITGEANLVGLSELLKHDNFVTQQYTGLTDSNDDPIYEGDIINLKFGELNANLVVKWDKYMGLKYHNGGWTSLVHVETHGEVIGNIFEHENLPN